MPDRETRRTQADDRIARELKRQQDERDESLRTAFRILERAHDGLKADDHFLVLSGLGHGDVPFRVALTKCPGGIEHLDNLANGRTKHECISIKMATESHEGHAQDGTDCSEHCSRALASATTGGP